MTLIAIPPIFARAQGPGGLNYSLVGRERTETPPTGRLLCVGSPHLLDNLPGLRARPRVQCIARGAICGLSLCVWLYILGPGPRDIKKPAWRRSRDVHAGLSDGHIGYWIIHDESPDQHTRTAATLPTCILPDIAPVVNAILPYYCGQLYVLILSVGNDPPAQGGSAKRRGGGPLDR